MYSYILKLHEFSPPSSFLSFLSLSWLHFPKHTKCVVQRETSSCDNMVCLCQAQRNVATDVKSVFVMKHSGWKMPSLKYKYLFPVKERSSMKAPDTVFILLLFRESILWDNGTSSSRYCLLYQFCTWCIRCAACSCSVKWLLLSSSSPLCKWRTWGPHRLCYLLC